MNTIHCRVSEQLFGVSARLDIRGSQHDPSGQVDGERRSMPTAATGVRHSQGKFPVPLSRNVPAMQADTFAQPQLRKPVCARNPGPGRMAIFVIRGRALGNSEIRRPTPTKTGQKRWPPDPGLRRNPSAAVNCFCLPRSTAFVGPKTTKPPVGQTGGGVSPRARSSGLGGKLTRGEFMRRTGSEQRGYAQGGRGSRRIIKAGDSVGNRQD